MLMQRNLRSVFGQVRRRFSSSPATESLEELRNKVETYNPTSGLGNSMLYGFTLYTTYEYIKFKLAYPDFERSVEESKQRSQSYEQMRAAADGASEDGAA